jgi:sodium pump decarboxylase gamma subunit
MSFMEYWDGSVAGAVILTGLVVVFVALIILIVVVKNTGRIVNQTASALQSSAKPSAPAPASAPVQAAAAPAPVVQQGIAAETVAVISAAIAAFMEEEAPGAQYSVASIQRSPNRRVQRPVWGFAGMQQNTRPF